MGIQVVKMYLKEYYYKINAGIIMNCDASLLFIHAYALTLIKKRFQQNNTLQFNRN